MSSGSSSSGWKMDRRGYATGGWKECVRGRALRRGGFARLKNEEAGVDGGVNNTGADVVFPMVDLLHVVVPREHCLVDQFAKSLLTGWGWLRREEIFGWPGIGRGDVGV